MEDKSFALNPENGGINCIGNGEHADEKGETVECMCDECDYLMLCIADDLQNTPPHPF